MFGLCRLCAKYTEPIELVTGIVELKSKLTLCCGWKPSENEEQFPQNACNSCVRQLEQSWNFAENVRAAEEQLNKIASELNSTYCEELQPHVEHVNILEIKLKGLMHNLDDKKQKLNKSTKEPSPEYVDELRPHIEGVTPTELEMLQHENLEIMAFDYPDNESDAESAHSKKSSENSLPITDPILAQLSEKYCLADGTISINGIDELQKLFPGMTKMTWSLCQFKCERCNRSFKSLQNFYSHNRSRHLEEMKSMSFFCFYCDSKHSREYFLNRHIAAEHFPHLMFSCFYCSDYFWDNGELIKHRKRHKDVEYQCELCDKRYNRVLLYSHIYTTHLRRYKRYSEPGPTKYTCDICNKEFITKKGIESHMQSHIKNLDYVCDQCGSKFHAKGILKNHLALHSYERPFACTKCDKKFKTKSRLHSHLKCHESELQECKKCSKKVRNMKTHMRIHDNIMPYTCKYCDRRFRQVNTLKVHERTHTNQKPYACNHCEYKSTNWPNLNKHSLRIHSIDLRKRNSS